MNADSARLNRLRRGIELALNHEWPVLDQTRRRLSAASVKPIDAEMPSARRIVATVAADGGEGRLGVEPIRIRVVRVADSDGEIYFEEFIPHSLEPGEVIRFFFAGNERVQRLLRFLGLTWEDLEPASDFQRTNLVSMLRELLEWATLLKLASEPTPTLLLRDGLLRSVLLNDHVFEQLRSKLQELATRHGHLLAGMAKRSAVISYLSLAFDLASSFRGVGVGSLRVSAELEREAAPSQYRWIGERAMGQLYLARLDVGESVPLMPVDVATWHSETEVAETLALLVRSSRASFPLRGYPMELVSAHRFASVSTLEVELLESILMDELTRREPGVAESVRQLRLLGQRLAENLEQTEDVT